MPNITIQWSIISEALYLRESVSGWIRMQEIVKVDTVFNIERNFCSMRVR